MPSKTTGADRAPRLRRSAHSGSPRACPTRTRPDCARDRTSRRTRASGDRQIAETARRRGNQLDGPGESPRRAQPGASRSPDRMRRLSSRRALDLRARCRQSTERSDAATTPGRPRRWPGAPTPPRSHAARSASAPAARSPRHPACGLPRPQPRPARPAARSPPCAPSACSAVVTAPPGPSCRRGWLRRAVQPSPDRCSPT